MKRTLLVAAILLTGCHSAAYEIATVQNNHDYRIARFHEDCGTPVKCDDAPLASCTARCKALNAEKKALNEAATALSNKGGMPLQMKALEAADKAAQ